MANDSFPLKVGSKGPNVKKLQQGLGIGADGGFGNDTKNAVILKQRENNLPETGEVNKAVFDLILGNTPFQFDVETLPIQNPQPIETSSPNTIIPYTPPGENPSPQTSSFGYNEIGQTLALGNQLGGNVNSLQGSLNALGEATGIDFLTFDPFTIPTLDLRFALNLIGIDLDEKLAEIRSSPGGAAALAQAQASFRDKQTGKYSVNAITSSLNTSSLDMFKDFPKTIEFGTVVGQIVDSQTNTPLPGVKIRNPLLKKATTDEKGEFTIQQPILPELLTDLGIISPSLFALTITLKKYTEPATETNQEPRTFRYRPKQYIPYTSTGKLKGYIKGETPNKGVGVVPLRRIESNLKKEIQKFLRFPDTQIKEYTQKDVTYDFAIQKQTDDAIKNLKKTVIPLLLVLIAVYGVSELNPLIKAKKSGIREEAQKEFDKIKDSITNPDKKDLKKIIKKKNKLVKVLNDTLKIIEDTILILDVAGDLIDITDTTYQILKVLPVPTAVAGVGIPISTVNNVQDVKTILDKRIIQARHITKTTLAILRLLENTLGTVVDLLDLLDMFIQFSNEFIEEDIESEEISDEIRDISKEEARQSSPIVTNVNGFEIGIEIENTSKKTKRKRAIARNKKGIIMLKGKYSFSSIDQILIDELSFYIQQNDLKAN
tara:strand:+ start:1390 stop:3363 length:1974 start_codon:yes stop_codon:yes gene_type:complete